MVWIPGRSEIEGNDRADTEAKKAAIDPALMQPHSTAQTAKIRACEILKTAAKEQWYKNWENAKTAKSPRHIMKTKRKGIKNGPSLYDEIANRSTATTIEQLRTSHCGLNLYL